MNRAWPHSRAVAARFSDFDFRRRIVRDSLGLPSGSTTYAQIATYFAIAVAAIFVVL